MKKKKGATYILSIYATKKTVREAVKKGCFISAAIATEAEKEHLADATAVEFDPPEWSDYEKEVPETRKIGFREPKSPVPRPRS
jgi:hypothetical protein